MYDTKELIRKLDSGEELSDGELLHLITGEDETELLFSLADAKRRKTYGNKVYTRGLIEFTNYCKNNCYYCGIRGGNQEAQRYRLTEEEILDCCREGYELGFRTFVLQGGEDPRFTDEMICSVTSRIRQEFPQCAITLSIGERSKEAYRNFRKAGADRYLLRHETADEELYRKLHPSSMSLAARKQCLWDLKELGYQVGTGFMVGAPYQTARNLLADLRFMQELQPDMIGIGPYLHHLQTPFASMPDGSFSLTLRLIAIIRLLFPYALIPATTALGTIHPQGREMGIKAGANVVMPNLSPVGVRKLYSLYENKICTGEGAAQCRGCLERRMRSVGYEIVTDRGDVIR